MLSRKTVMTMGLVAVLAAVVAVEAGLLWRARQRAHKALAALAQKQQARDWLARQTPAPTPENVAATVADVAAARRRLERMQRELTFSVEPGASGAAPERPADGFFALQQLNDELRRRAQAVRVNLGSGERFGFASHALEGPEPELLPVVHRQSVAMRHLVETLLAAHPVALLAVRREEPASGDRAGATAGSLDFFVPAPGWLVRQAGMIDSDAFRFEFAGHTTVLREFMQALGTAEQPVLIRAVEVEPAAAGSGVASAEAKFSVQLEVPRLAVKPDVSR